MTHMAQKANIKTIGGLLQILEDNIDSLNQDASDANVRKNNAILQNVNAVRGIYNLAFAKERLTNIYKINDYYSPYLSEEVLMGSVFGDNTERFEHDREIMQRRRQEEYESLMERLRRELEENEDNQDADQEHFKYQSYNDKEIKVMNNLLFKTRKKLASEYEKDLYLYKHLKPEHFLGVETEYE